MALLDTGPLNSRSRSDFIVAAPRITTPCASSVAPPNTCTPGPPVLSFKRRSRPIISIHQTSPQNSSIPCSSTVTNITPAVLMVPPKNPIVIAPVIPTGNGRVSPPSPIDKEENITPAISLTLRVQPQPRTPPASGVHQLPPSPPPSSERLGRVISDFQGALLAPYLQAPKVPSAIHLLTPDLFYRLVAFAHSSPVAIPCPSQYFSVWRTRNSRWLEDFDSRWEYDSRKGLFIIKCMPTPIHEAFAVHATCVIHEEIRRLTSMRANSANISIATNTDMIDSPHLPSRRIPDLSFKVRLHPQTPIQTRRGVVVEVGFAQSLPSLLHRAELWLLDRRDQVHMVILVHIPEVIPKKYLLPQDKGGVEIPAGKARKGMLKWQKAWFGGRSFEEEVITRWVGEEEGKEQEVVEELKKDMMNKLLEADERGELLPPLLHPLDGKIYVFKRKEEAEDAQVVSTQASSAKEGDNEEALAQIVSLQGSCAKEGDNEEAPAGKRKRKEEGDLFGYYSSDDSETGSTTLADVSDTEVNKEGASTDRPNISLIRRQNHNPSHANDPLEEIFSDSSPTSSSTEEDNEPDRSSQLTCINDITFLHNNLYTPPTPSTTATPHALTISICDLYGPLPTPSTLSLIPLALRPHAHQKITLDLEELAERIIAEDVLYEMRVRRAGERAAKIVDGEWMGWVKRREEERNRVRVKEGRRERDERRVRRDREGGARNGRKRGRGG